MNVLCEFAKRYVPPEQARNQRNHFMKNVSIVGGLVFVIGVGAGPLSVDARRRRHSELP